MNDELLEKFYNEYLYEDYKIPFNSLDSGLKKFISKSASYEYYRTVEAINDLKRTIKKEFSRTLVQISKAINHLKKNPNP